MKKFCAILLLLLTVTAVSNLRATDFAKRWNWMHPYPTANSLGVSAIKDQVIAVAGANGYLAISKDYGTTWEEQILPTNEEITTILLANYPNKVTVITRSGQIYDTKGQTLGSTQSTVNNFAINTPTSTIWLACDGGKLLYSSNGTSWSSRQTLVGSANITSIFFKDQNGWFTTNNGKIFSTTNNGQNWGEQTTDFTLPIFNVYFVSNLVGWAMCDGGTILHTTDGGVKWAKQTTPTLYSLNACYFENENRGWASGKYGSLLSTQDGGTTWTSIKFEDVYGDLNSMSWINSKMIVTGSNGEILVGEVGNGNFTIASKSLLSFNLRSINTNGNNVIAVGDNGGILVSQNKGNDWKKITSIYDKRINTCQFFNADTAYIGTIEGTIYRTFDGGSTWKTQSLDNDKEITAMSFNGSKGFLVGYKSVIYSSENSGKKWTLSLVNTPKAIDLFAVFYRGGNNAWACGSDGGIVRTTDGGETWDKVTAVTTETLNGICVSGNIGFAVGTKGTVLKTTDAGATWTKVELAITTDLTAVYLAEDGNNAILVGKGGLMYSTSDASTWTKTALTASQSIYGLSASTVNSVFGAWICGESGMVMSHNVSAATVQDYTQINNIKIELFPNPASDMLRIKNSIELSNLNFIEFYNVLGDKVLEYPVNANNNIDNYEFNVQGLNSGIYIIKLYSNSASYSVRMVKN